MCQPVSGPEVVLKERWAWKVFCTNKEGNLVGVYFSRTGVDGGTAVYKTDKWYKSHRRPGFFEYPSGYSKTCSGFHVFRNKKDATAYGSTFFRLIRRVRVRGKAIPFSGGWGDGWAVHEMLILGDA